MKFKLETPDPKDKKLCLFSDREPGDLTTFDNESSKLTVTRFSKHSNNEFLFGREVLLHELIKYLTSEGTQHKIVSLYCSALSGKYQTSLFAINYCMDRKFFKDGAIEINAYNMTTCKEVLQEIRDKLAMVSDKKNDIVDKLREMNIVILIHGCGWILMEKKEESDFYHFLRQVAEKTDKVKIIFFVRCSYEKK
jgi:hypothetical protein